MSDLYRRWIDAPGNEAGLRPPALVGVYADEEDNIEWIWTYGPDGQRVVTGYRIQPTLVDVFEHAKLAGEGK